MLFDLNGNSSKRGEEIDGDGDKEESTASLRKERERADRGANPLAANDRPAFSQP
jgi:hypothetical protein